MILHKNPEAVRHSKVKGHATQEMVDKGMVRAKDKQGNDHSDGYQDV